MRIVIALGGNALLRRGESPEESTQVARLEEVAPALATLAHDNELVIVHGNGPQVGLLAAENQADTSITAAYPLADMVAESQGLIGLWIQQTLHNADPKIQAATIVCQTVVDLDDPAWQQPTKFIGPSLSTERVADLTAQLNWTFANDGGTRRRVVASPAPLDVIELGVIETLLSAGVIVIAAGGGGVPVTRQDRRLTSVDAVVDKDAVAALLAIELDSDLFAILTDVPAVMSDFGTPQQRTIESTTSTQLRQYTFAAGSMGPKVQAAEHFVEQTGRRAAIGGLDELGAVIAGTSGTQIRG